MKRIGWVGLGMVAALVLWYGVAGADEKIGVVDVNKVFSNYGKVTESQAEFDKFRDARQAEVKVKADAAEKEIKALQDKLDKQAKALKKEEADKIKSDISEKRQKALELQREVYQELQQKNRDLVEARVKEITEAIAKLAKEKGYTVMINKEAVLYSPDAADLSDQVIATLNKPAAAAK